MKNQVLFRVSEFDCGDEVPRVVILITSNSEVEGQEMSSRLSLYKNRLMIMESKNLLIVTSMVMFLASCTATSTQHEATMAQLNEVQKELQVINARLDDFEERLQQNPKTARFDVNFGDDPILGSHEARIAIVEFSDYQCPYCKRFQTQVFPQLKKEYIDSGKVAFVYKDFPLAMHANAKSAAIAANCAGEQDDYLDYQKALFEDQKAFGHDHYVVLAEQHKLDTDRFSTCLDDKKQIEEIEKDQAYGSSLGLTGTPSFFIGRVDQSDRVVSARLVVGAQPLHVFREVIDGLLTKVN